MPFFHQRGGAAGGWALFAVFVMTPMLSSCASEQARGGDAAAEDVAADTAVDIGAGSDVQAVEHDAGTDAAAGCTAASDCPASPNPCLQPSCDASVGCKLVVRPDGTACDDGDKCTAGERCSNGTCSPASATGCDDLNACTSDVCDPKTGACVNNAKLDGAKCDDGDSCNGDTDSCQQGKCAGGPNICQCDKDSDCKQFEDGNPCNGTLRCAKDGAVGLCKVDVKTVIKCDSKNDTDCTKAQCQADGSCAVKPVIGLVACNDGDKCTANDQCQGGACKGTYACECEKTADCAKKEDGDLCNGTLICSAANTCVVNPATVVKCGGSTNNPCTVNTCAAKTGACVESPVLDGNPCDDGDPCWVGDACVSGTCAQGTTKKCDCTKDADCPDDNNACNGTLACDPKSKQCVVNLASVVTCTDKDGNVCTVAGCDPASGSCKEKPGKDGAGCDDGDACTTGEVCAKGACGMSKPAVDCDDKDPCTTDACNPKTAKCEHSKITGCGAPVVLPTEATTLFAFLAAGKYKVGFFGESKVHSGSIHAPVRSWFNPQLFQSLQKANKSHPIGAAAVKELYNSDAKTLKGWAVNIKVDDDGKSTDWYSYEVFSTTSGANPVVNGKGVPLCVGCHKAGKDFVLSKFPLL